MWKRVAMLGAMAWSLACGGGDSAPTNPGGGQQNTNVGTSITVAPKSLTLIVLGTGNLTATVRSASGDAIAGAVTGWDARSKAVASVDKSGRVTGVSPGSTYVVAMSGALSDSSLVTVIDALASLEVLPAAAQIPVLGTQAYTVVARGTTGQVIPTPPVNWTSMHPAIATINAAGVATGISPGTADIVATSGIVTSLPAKLTVTANAGACDNIASQVEFDGAMQFTYGGRQVVNGLEVISGITGTLNAVLTRVGLPLPAPALQVWTGVITGGFTLTDLSTDVSTGAKQRLDGAGPVFTTLPTPSTMSLFVNLGTCRWKATVITSGALRFTDEGGRTSAADGPVNTLQSAEAPLGTWRTFGLDVSGQYPGHSAIWSAQNGTAAAFAPLGFGVRYFAGDLNAAVGAATVTGRITRR